MAKALETDIAIIGAGSGGLSVAAGAVQMGARVVLIERGKMGGDCLNYGCVPSKSIIAAAHAANTVRHGSVFGVNGHEPEIDFAKVHGHIHSVIGAIAPHDSVERFEGLGVIIIQEAARFTGPTEIQAGDTTVRARKIVVATGSSAFVPPIDGLADVAYLTNETIFDLTERPEHLIVVGGGPIGSEMAQAHRRLGAEVTQIEKGTILGKDDPDAVEVVRQRFLAEGINLLENSGVKRVERQGNGVRVFIDRDGKEESIDGSHLLVAVGRAANVAGLDLEKAGIDYTPRGIKTDAGLRTTNRSVYAIGDVAGSYQFTHMAGYHAGIIIRSALFKMPAKVDYKAVPWVTFTDPELAHVGKSEAEAKKAHGEAGIRVLSWSFAENDRAQAERQTEGFIKVVTRANGKILGATIVGAHAGELLMPWVLAISNNMKIGQMATVIAPYPTLSEVSKRVAGSYYTPTLFSDRTKSVVRFLQKLPI